MIGFADSGVTIDGVILRVKDTELSWLGYSRDEILGWSKFADLLTPDSAELFASYFSILRERDSAHEIEFNMVRKDGTIMPVLLNATALRDADGNFVKCRCTIIDITDRKRLETEEKLRLLLDSTGEALYGIDMEGRCTFCNPACLQLLGYQQPEDLLGKRIHDLMHHTHADGTPYPAEKCRFYRAIRGGKRGTEDLVDLRRLHHDDRAQGVFHGPDMFALGGMMGKGDVQGPFQEPARCGRPTVLTFTSATRAAER